MPSRVRIVEDVRQLSGKVHIAATGYKIQVVQPGTTTAVTVYQAATGGATHSWFGTDSTGMIVPFNADPATTGTAIAGGEMWADKQPIELRVMTLANVEVTRERLELVSAADALSVETAIVSEIPPNVHQYRESGDVSWDQAVTRLFASGATVGYVPPKTTAYDMAAGVTLPKGMSLVLDAGATLQATAVMAGAMIATENDGVSGHWWRDKVIQGGVLDCNGLAANGLDIPYALNSRIESIIVKEQTGHGILLGDTGAPGQSNELHLLNVKVDRTTSGTVPASSFGIWLRNAYDSDLTRCVVVGANTSFRIDKTDTTLTACHGWGWAGHLPVAIFDDTGSQNTYLGCKADTPSAYGFRFRGFNGKVIGGLAYNNASAGSDNVVEAVHFDQATPFSAVWALEVVGADASHRFAKDVGGLTFPNAGFHGHTINTNVVTQNSSIMRTNVFATNSWIQPSGGCHIYSGSGAPAISANTIGDLFFRVDGGAGTLIYRANTAGSATTGAWTAML